MTNISQITDLRGDAGCVGDLGLATALPATVMDTEGVVEVGVVMEPELEVDMPSPIEGPHSPDKLVTCINTTYHYTWMNTTLQLDKCSILLHLVTLSQVLGIRV